MPKLGLKLDSYIMLFARAYESREAGEERSLPLFFALAYESRGSLRGKAVASRF
jgi:hypothetical protein